jgi:hypothetical protein
LPGATCSKYITKTFPQAQVTWSFEYGATAESRKAGMSDLKRATQNLDR